jgi:ribonuclease HI
MSKIYKLFTDGGSRGNPGPAGIGAVLFNSEDKVIDITSAFLKQATNNIAEYKGLLEGLVLAKKNKIKDVKCHLDSELVVKQMKGEYKVKDENLQQLKSEIDEYIKNFDSVNFEHVRREHNKLADKLVNLAMDTALNI